MLVLRNLVSDILSFFVNLDLFPSILPGTGLCTETGSDIMGYFLIFKFYSCLKF